MSTPFPFPDKESLSRDGARQSVVLARPSFLSVFGLLAIALAACESGPPPMKADPGTKASVAIPASTGLDPFAGKEKETIPAPADVAAPPADAIKTATGVAYKVLEKSAKDDKPTARDMVSVHYTGWTTDGKMFDSSVLRKRPAQFGVKGVIKGWTEVLQLMDAGDRVRVWIPKELAYDGKPGRPQGMLVFDIELLTIQHAPKPVPAPPDVKEAPADAEKTKSGLASKVLKKGTGTVHPLATSQVKVHYTGWQAKDGEMFDTSSGRDPVTFPLDRVIKGWGEGVQLMVVGESRRFWIPADMAYGDQPNMPSGMLVFDVELLDIVSMPTAPSASAAGSTTGAKTPPSASASGKPVAPPSTKPATPSAKPPEAKVG